MYRCVNIINLTLWINMKNSNDDKCNGQRRMEGEVREIKRMNPS
jgi:hypothetical protein